MKKDINTLIYRALRTKTEAEALEILGTKTLFTVIEDEDGDNSVQGYVTLTHPKGVEFVISKDMGGTTSLYDRYTNIKSGFKDMKHFDFDNYIETHPGRVARRIAERKEPTAIETYKDLKYQSYRAKGDEEFYERRLASIRKQMAELEEELIQYEDRQARAIDRSEAINKEMQTFVKNRLGVTK